MPGILEGYTFIPLSEQLSETWLGSAADTIRATAEFLEQSGRIDGVADDYTEFVNTKIAKEAAK